MIRYAAAADAAPLAEFAARTFLETFVPQNRAKDVHEYVAKAYASEQQAREISDPTIVTLLAEIDGQLAGFAQLKIGAAMEMARFYIDRRWQGRGVAQELMRAVEEEAQHRGISTIWLGVWERNARAIAFYAKCGFEVTGSHPFLLGSDLQTDLEMTKRLSPRA